MSSATHPGHIQVFSCLGRRREFWLPSRAARSEGVMQDDHAGLLSEYFGPIRVCGWGVWMSGSAAPNTTAIPTYHA